MSEWSEKLCHGLYELQQSQKLCDTVMESAQATQHALHSCVLATASQSFSRLEGEPPFLLKCEQISGQSIDVLIKLLYTGDLQDVGMSQEVLREVLEGAESLCIPHICRYVEQLLQETAILSQVPDWTNDETDQSLDVEAAESPGPVKCEENPSTQLGGAGEMVHISEDQTQLSTVTGKEAIVHPDSSHVTRGLDVAPEDGLNVKVDDADVRRGNQPCGAALSQTEHSKKLSTEVNKCSQFGDEISGEMTFICTVDDPNLLSSGKDMANSESEPSSEESGQLTAGIQGSCITEDLSASVMISSVTEVSLDKTVCPLTVIQSNIKQMNQDIEECGVGGDPSQTPKHSSSVSPVPEPDTQVRLQSSQSSKQGSPSAVVGTSSKNRFDPRVLQFLKRQKKMAEKKKAGTPNEGVMQSKTQTKPVKVKLTNLQADENTGSSLSWSELKSYIKKEEKLIGGNNAQYRCSICGLLKNGYENFLGHKLQHAGVVPFHCRHCGKGFYRKTDGQRHEQKGICRSRCSYSVLQNNSDGSLKVSKIIKKDESIRKDGKNWYKCSICDKLMIGHETFLAHKFDHAGMKAFVCKICQQEFSRRTEWKKHVQICHQDLVTLTTQGDVAEGTVNTSDSVDNKEKQRALSDSSGHVTNVFSCDIWENNSLRLKEALRVLEESSREVLMDNLRLAEASTKRAGDGVSGDHMVGPEFAQPSVFSCDHCTETFSKKWDLNAHVRALHNPQTDAQYTCQNCQKSYTTRAHFRNHFKKSRLCVMNEDMKTFLEEEDRADNVCGLCGKKYASRFYLDIHRKSHEGRSHACKTCGQTFLLASNLAIHMKRHLGQKQYICRYCDKKFVRNCELRYHLLSHSGKSIHCEECGKEFKHRNSLHLHMQLHNKARQYLCDLCGKAFAQKGNLKKHKKETHASHYNYECVVCDKKFYTEGGLQAHKKTKHSGLRPHTCPVCCKSFAVHVNLRRHMLTHSDQKPFPCPECSKHFRLLAHLRRHLMTVHNISRDQVMTMSLEDGGVMQHTSAEDPGNLEDNILQTEYVFVCQDDSLKQEEGLPLATSVTTEVGRVDNGGAQNTVATVTTPQLVVLDKDGLPMELPPDFVVESQRVYSTEGTGVPEVHYYTTTL